MALLTEAECPLLTIPHSNLTNLTAFTGQELEGLCSTGHVTADGGMHVTAVCSSAVEKTWQFISCKR